MYRAKHFKLQELVCAHVYFKYGDQAWDFLDDKQMELMDWIGERLGVVIVNNYHLPVYANSDYIKYIAKQASADPQLPIIASQVPVKPKLLQDQRGLRCNLCQLYLDKTNAGIIYVSGHGLARADDFDVKGYTAQQVRQYIIDHQAELPFPIRLEKNVLWVHMDSEDTGEKVHQF
jgi:hypothetical protein